jgi:Lectin C-type domain/Putative metal-binding motif
MPAMRSCWALAVVLVGCAKGGTPAEPDGAPTADACVPQTYFADRDGDGHGDPAAPVVACAPPAMSATISDDCDDTTAERFPGNPELCDGLDNDCDAATTEVCPAGCTVQRRPPPDAARTYLFCSNPQAWANARLTCSGAGYTLVQIDDAGENAFVRATATALLGTGPIHIGASDLAAEGTWVWEESGEPFWQGGSGGVSVGNRFESWDPGEPNDDGTEDCGELGANQLWNDSGCGDSQRFACRR